MVAVRLMIVVDQLPPFAAPVVTQIGGARAAEAAPWARPIVMAQQQRWS